jgi:hypothetical protein
MADVGASPRNYVAISWLIRHILVENIRQNWLRQESTSVIIVINYWAILWLTRHTCILVENIRQNWLGVMTDVDSCRNQFCLMLSIRLCLVSHDIGQ